ncbi:MAG: hypothetical protein ACP5I8_15655 [Phycisphaerae bacterium]
MVIRPRLNLTKVHAHLVRWLAVGVCLSSALAVAGPCRQRSITIVDLMPNLPQPYHMRNWAKISRAFYTLLLDRQARGPFLPLTHIVRNARHNPIAFVIPAYVSRVPDTRSKGQAFTEMGAVWGATLVGRNMSSTGRIDYVRLLDNFFVPKMGHGLFSDYIGSASGVQKTAWYTLFPDITAAAISARYPAEKTLATMCRATARTWAEAIPHFRKRDGRYDFNDRGFDFSTMRPVYDGRWCEPDMAASIAWVEYMAWRRWHDPAFLHGAKACMQYLSALPPTDNPSFEVQIPFGTLAAVRMNAELGMNYPTQKFVYWCFSRYNEGRPWAVEAARWGGKDVDGLVGGINCAPWRQWGVGGNAYFLETLTQLWALAPIPRYDQRYAVVVGKWILNAANASRLFYGKFHSLEHQSDPDWKLGRSLVPYEELKYRHDYPGQPLIATGDNKTFLDPKYPVFNRGKDATNYGLYGGVYVGVLGALVEKTNVRGILQINLRATDTSAPAGYPTFLFYNPHRHMKAVRINVGSKEVNLYNTITGTFTAHHVSGAAAVSVPGDSAVVLVYTPADGKVSYRSHETLVNGRVIDYLHGQGGGT